MTDSTLTEIEKAMLWERMSGERLSDAERQRILDGGEFHAPGGITNATDPVVEYHEGTGFGELLSPEEGRRRLVQYRQVQTTAI
jgi:hypothetical protein